MAIVELSFLGSLSYKGAVDLLLQEGYVEEKEVEVTDSTCDRKFLYPYVLYDGSNWRHQAKQKRIAGRN